VNPDDPDPGNLDLLEPNSEIFASTEFASAVSDMLQTISQATFSFLQQGAPYFASS